MRRANGGNAITDDLFELFLDILTDDKHYMVVRALFIKSSTNVELSYYMKKAHLHGADRLKMGIKIPCQLSPAGLIRIFTCKGLPALSAELHLALVPEEVHL